METAAPGVADLADLATSALGPGGPVGALLQPVADALGNVWEGYFGSPVPPGRTNWNAYTHQQLYDMLWQHADVGDVSSVAAEWGRHSSELTEHATSLHDQRGALRDNWRGRAADLAASRLGELGDRTAGIGSRAGTVQQATQHAGDALSTARNTMPKPPGDPTALAVAAGAAGAAAGAAIGGVVGAGAGGIGAGPGALMGAAIGAVVAGGGSLFLANVAAAEQKAEAVHVMQRYEDSLQQASAAVADTPAGATDPLRFGAGAGEKHTSASGFSGGALPGGASWHNLVGANPAALAAEPGLAADARGGSGLLAQALRSRAGALAQLAAARNANAAGLAGGAGARGHGEEDQEHHSRLPTVDHRLFDLDERAAGPVIGI